MKSFMRDFIAEVVPGILLTLLIPMLMYFVITAFYKQSYKPDIQVIVVRSVSCTNCPCNKQFHSED